MSGTQGPISSTRRAILWWCLVALVAAQAIGFMHRVVHGPQARVQAATSVHASHGWVQSLFATHDDDSTCRLLDSIGHQGPCAPAVEVGVQLPAPIVIAVSDGQFVSRRAALLRSRGPPASSFA